MDVLQLVVSALAGLAAAIPLVVQLVKYVQKAVQLIFPEIEYDKVDKVRGMDVICVTTAKTDEEARELLKLFNMPFAK